MFQFKPVWAILSLGTLCACQFNTASLHGRFAVAIQWPQAGFQTLAIPAETQEMQIVIRDQQRTVLNERISRQAPLLVSSTL